MMDTPAEWRPVILKDGKIQDFPPVRDVEASSLANSGLTCSTAEQDPINPSYEHDGLAWSVSDDHRSRA